METFEIIAELCSVVGLVFAVAIWTYERWKTKRIDPHKDQGRVTYWWTRL